MAISAEAKKFIHDTAMYARAYISNSLANHNPYHADRAIEGLGWLELQNSGMLANGSIDDVIDGLVGEAHALAFGTNRVYVTLFNRDEAIPKEHRQEGFLTRAFRKQSLSQAVKYLENRFSEMKGFDQDEDLVKRVQFFMMKAIYQAAGDQLEELETAEQDKIVQQELEREYDEVEVEVEVKVPAF